MADLQMDGWAEIKQRFTDLPDKMIKNVLRAAMREAANLIKDEAKRRAPVGGGADPHPGALRDSIRVVARRGTPTRVVFNVVAGGDFSGAKQGKYGIQSAYYALWVERGHWVNTGKALGGTGKDAQRTARIRAGATKFAPPHPFMRPALEGGAQAAIDRVVMGISDRLPELVR